MSHDNQPLHPETVSNHPVVVAFKVTDVQNRLSAEERDALRSVNRVTLPMIALAADIVERFGLEAEFDLESARRYLKLEQDLRPSIKELTLLLAQHEDTILRAKERPALEFWKLYRVLKLQVACRNRNDRLAQMVEELQDHLARSPSKPAKKGATPTP